MGNLGHHHIGVHLDGDLQVVGQFGAIGGAPALEFLDIIDHILNGKGPVDPVHALGVGGVGFGGDLPILIHGVSLVDVLNVLGHELHKISQGGIVGGDGTGLFIFPGGDKGKGNGTVGIPGHAVEIRHPVFIHVIGRKNGSQRGFHIFNHAVHGNDLGGFFLGCLLSDGILGFFPVQGVVGHFFQGSIGFDQGAPIPLGRGQVVKFISIHPEITGEIIPIPFLNHSLLGLGEIARLKGCQGVSILTHLGAVFKGDPSALIRGGQGRFLARGDAHGIPFKNGPLVHGQSAVVGLDNHPFQGIVLMGPGPGAILVEGAHPLAAELVHNHISVSGRHFLDMDAPGFQLGNEPGRKAVGQIVCLRGPVTAQVTSHKADTPHHVPVGQNILFCQQLGHLLGIHGFDLRGTGMAHNDNTGVGIGNHRIALLGNEVLAIPSHEGTAFRMLVVNLVGAVHHGTVI